MSSHIYNTFYIFHVGYYYNCQIEKRVHIISWISKINLSTASMLLFKSETVHALFHFLLFIIVFKAITIPLKDPNILIILCVFTMILLSFNFFLYVINIYTFESKNHNHQVGIFLCIWNLSQQKPVQRGH